MIVRHLFTTRIGELAGDGTREFPPYMSAILQGSGTPFGPHRNSLPMPSQSVGKLMICDVIVQNVRPLWFPFCSHHNSQELPTRDGLYRLAWGQLNSG
jgi:hypothetical protein